MATRCLVEFPEDTQSPESGGVLLYLRRGGLSFTVTEGDGMALGVGCFFIW